MHKFRDIVSERIRLFDEFSFYGAFVAGLPVYSTKAVDTLAVDRNGVIYINEDFWYAAPFEHRVGFLVHESQHPMRNHFARAEAANIPMKAANICQDAEINDGAKLRRFLPKTGIIFPETYGWKPGKMFEEYWQDYPEEDEGGDEGGSEGEERQVGNGDCGSGASGEPRDYELPAPEDGGPGKDACDLEVMRRQAAKAVKEAEARNPGCAGGSALRWATDFLAPPKVSWKSQLKRNARCFREWMRGNTSTTYSRMHRRRSSARILHPGMIDPIPNISVLVDTSCSMDETIGPKVLAEVQGCLRAGAGSSGTVLVCDAKMHEIKKVKRVSAMSFSGGGGTDMRIGIAAAAKLKNRPDYLVILTDGYTPWPSAPPPRMRVIIGLIGKYKAPLSDMPSWAKVIDIPMD